MGRYTQSRPIMRLVMTLLVALAWGLAASPASSAPADGGEQQWLEPGGADPAFLDIRSGHQAQVVLDVKNFSLVEDLAVRKLRLYSLPPAFMLKDANAAPNAPLGPNAYLIDVDSNDSLPVLKSQSRAYQVSLAHDALEKACRNGRFAVAVVDEKNRESRGKVTLVCPSPAIELLGSAATWNCSGAEPTLTVGVANGSNGRAQIAAVRVRAHSEAGTAEFERIFDPPEFFDHTTPLGLAVKGTQEQIATLFAQPGILVEVRRYFDEQSAVTTIVRPPHNGLHIIDVHPYPDRGEMRLSVVNTGKCLARLGTVELFERDDVELGSRIDRPEIILPQRRETVKIDLSTENQRFLRLPQIFIRLAASSAPDQTARPKMKVASRGFGPSTGLGALHLTPERRLRRLDDATFGLDLSVSNPSAITKTLATIELARTAEGDQRKLLVLPRPSQIPPDSARADGPEGQRQTVTVALPLPAFGDLLGDGAFYIRHADPPEDMRLPFIRADGLWRDSERNRLVAEPFLLANHSLLIRTSQQGEAQGLPPNAPSELIVFHGGLPVVRVPVQGQPCVVLAPETWKRYVENGRLAFAVRDATNAGFSAHQMAAKSQSVPLDPEKTVEVPAGCGGVVRSDAVPPSGDKPPTVLTQDSSPVPAGPGASGGTTIHRPWLPAALFGLGALATLVVLAGIWLRRPVVAGLGLMAAAAFVTTVAGSHHNWLAVLLVLAGVGFHGRAAWLAARNRAERRALVADLDAWTGENRRFWAVLLSTSAVLVLESAAIFAAALHLPAILAFAQRGT